MYSLAHGEADVQWRAVRRRFKSRAVTCGESLISGSRRGASLVRRPVTIAHYTGAPPPPTDNNALHLYVDYDFRRGLSFVTRGVARLKRRRRPTRTMTISPTEYFRTKALRVLCAANRPCRRLAVTHGPFWSHRDPRSEHQRYSYINRRARNMCSAVGSFTDRPQPRMDRQSRAACRNDHPT